MGITEARGRLMERNGEDYVCPNCTTKKSQTAKPNGKPKAAAPGALKAEQSPSVAAPSPTASAGAEEKGDDLGFKGRIEKTTNPSGKKKIKIFQAVGLLLFSQPQWMNLTNDLFRLIMSCQQWLA